MPGRVRNWAGMVLLMAAGGVCGAQAAGARGEAEVTWARDVAPLLYGHCATCHHVGGAGPFSILGYAAAKRWGPQIAVATGSRFMPPWLPEPGYGEFADERRLTDAEIAMVKRWVEAGMPQGDAAAAPKEPVYDTTWQMGKPDLVLTIAEPYLLQANGTDVFRNFVFPYLGKETRYVRAMEIRPTPARVVHHANVLIDRLGSLRAAHPRDWQQSVAGMEILLDAGNTFDPDSHFLFWKPDTPVLVEEAGMPWRLDAGNDLILNIHLKPSGKAEKVEAQIGLYFTDQPPVKQPMLVQLDRDDALDIPAGAKDFVVEDQLTLPVDVEVLGIYPHAHYLGRDMQGWAELPGGEKRWLVWIKDWDIDRQSVYRYREPMALPKGTVLHMRYVYDNTEENVHNPHSPPVRVRAGNRSEDEMSHLWLQVLPAPAGPGEPDPRLKLEEAWMRNRLSKSPDDRVTLYNLGAALVGEGRFAEAVGVYEQSRKKHAADARLLTAEGVALNGAGEWQKARVEFAGAARDAGASAVQRCDAEYDLASLDLRHEDWPAAEREFRAMVGECGTDAGAHAGLAQVLEQKGDGEGARLELEAAVKLEPGNAEWHGELARNWAESGDLAKAEAELREAARLSPAEAEWHGALSQVLAGEGRLMAAIGEQKRALELNEADADGWNNLGVMEARSGMTTAARADFEHALRIDPGHAQARANLDRLGRP